MDFVLLKWVSLKKKKKRDWNELHDGENVAEFEAFIGLEEMRG